MARPPVRTRQREPGNQLAVADGFAGARIVPHQDRERQLPQDNSEAAHFDAILNSGLQDRMTDEEAFDVSTQRRISDNFGPELARYRRELAGQGGAPQHQVDYAGGRPNPAAPRLGYQPQNPQPQGRPGQLAVQNRQRNALGQHNPGNPGNPRAPTDWFQLRTLGPYALTQVRALGRQIFEVYAEHVQLEDINCLSAQVHDRAHVVDTIRWITENGNEIMTDNLDFGANIPGYRAGVSLWEVDKFTFLVVRDNHGEYVYGWPAALAPALENRPDTLRLR